MPNNSQRREALLAHCAEVREDDGLDPREFFKRSSSSSGRKRKTTQLCNQVAQALAQILASEFDDDVLLGLTVLAVEPASGESQLHVTLVADPGQIVPRDEILRRLAQASGFLRSEVAACVTRKRAPQLLFRVV
jgi:ribosome-binding factor A